MRVLAIFDVKGATAEKYDEAIRRLTEIGQRVPDGHMYHVAFGDKRRLQVISVFESRELFEAFSETLKPILKEVGIKATPTVYNVHNIIGG